jgi:aryl-alcohol dehydrogenase-like predicted oxidoreductase
VTSMMTTAAAAGTWKLGDLSVNRRGFGAMRLPGTGNPDHLEENVAAAAIHLSADDLARLEPETAGAQ